MRKVMQNRKHSSDDGLRMGMMGLRACVLAVFSIDLTLSLYSGFGSGGNIKLVFFVLAIAFLKSNIGWVFMAFYLMVFCWELLVV